MAPYSSLETFCIASRVWLLDVLWPLAKKGVEITTVVYFWYADHLFWAMITTSAILLPGILEVIYWTVTTMYNCRRKGCCYWSFLFNPLLYPFTMMAWNVSVITSGMSVYVEKYPTTRVLTMIQTLSESVLMMIAQIYILMQTFRFSLMNIFQGMSALMCLLTIAKEFGEHHFHELSGKTDIPSLGQIGAGFFFFFIQIVLRLPSLLLLTICLRHMILLFASIFVFVNFLVAFKLKTDVSKNIWTSFAALVAPICFVGKLKIPHYKHAGDTFHRFYLWNSLTFFILSLFSHIALNFMLVYGNDDVGKWLLENIRLVPLLGDGCFSSGQVCPGVHIISTIAVISSLLQPMFVWAQPLLFPVMIGEHFPKTSSIVDL